MDALILFGCVHCSGSGSEKAAVFYRVVMPAYETAIQFSNKDLRKSFLFMVNTATIFEELTRDLIEAPTAPLDAKAYEFRIRKYKPTFDGMVDQFLDSVFGEAHNRRSREDFIERLSSDSWKYFDIKNLNEMFTICLDKCGTIEIEEEMNIDAAVDIKKEQSEHIQIGLYPNFPSSRTLIVAPPQTSKAKFIRNYADA